MTLNNQFGIRVPEGTSYVSRKLAADPELRARCEEIAAAIREAAREDIEAGERTMMANPFPLGSPIL